MKRPFFLCFILLLQIPMFGFAQTQSDFYALYVQAAKDTLSSPFFHGRGYLKDGQKLSAYHIATEFVKIGLKNFNPTPSYYQSFWKCRIFSPSTNLGLRPRLLTCGIDFCPTPSCPSRFKAIIPFCGLTLVIFKTPRNSNRFLKKTCVLRFW